MDDNLRPIFFFKKYIKAAHSWGASNLRSRDDNEKEENHSKKRDVLTKNLMPLDIYSLGIILWKISNDGISPFGRELKTNLSLPLPTSTNNDFIDLINETIVKIKREKYIPGIPSKYKGIYSEKAFELYSKFAKKGNIVARLNQKGLQLHSKSAPAGNLNATNNAGYCYGKGVGVVVDKKEAFRRYFEGDEKENPKTQHNLRHLYAKGYGINQNQVKAFEWHENSAEYGHANGKYIIGKYFCEGFVTR
ncbi:hypothetical protein Glove_60g93 [Diversispora epigaea]|uniref:Protein kinase domain-containing protein n=1 Tax=Diversispora epigaea TaxID=1348612 RepID=A0A397JBP3_9GLOM|nr:hypothetical protein Glove_60g93 [Diversispora epigaea]